MNVVVIGAGISGLSAAWTLKQSGIDAVVLESADQPGGRMRSLSLSGALMELGAQFLSTGYAVVPQLARACELPLVPVAPGAAVVTDGALHPFRADRALSLFRGGVLPWSAAWGAGRGFVRLRSAVHGRAAHDLTAWADLDDQSGADWARQVLGAPMADRFLAAAVNGFYFQSLADSGAPLAAAVASFGASPARTVTLDGGLGTLTEALALRVDVRLGMRVTRVERAGSGARVHVAGGDVVEADRVVLALPGPAAAPVLADALPVEAELVATPYSSGLLAGLVLDRPLDETELGGAYGVLVHPDERSDVAALAVASRSQSGRQPEGDVLTVMLGDAASRRLLGADDETVVAAARAGLDRLLPGLPVHVGAHVERWPAAMPTVPPGHARRVAAYQDGLPADVPIVLAGDYLGFPWTDSAASTGRWAAGQVLEGRAALRRIGT